MRRQVMLALVGFIFAALLAGCAGLGPSRTPAALKVDPTGTLDFGQTGTELHVQIDNAGKKTLEWSVAVADGEDWLTVSPLSGKDNGTLTLTADRTGLAPGSEHRAKLEISSNGGSETLAVTMSVPAAAGDPVLRVQPSETLQFGENMDALQLMISNAGEGTLSWSVKAKGADGWLAIMPNRGKNDATVTLSADRTGLSPGSDYAAQLEIVSNGGNALLNVSLSVAAEPVTPPLPPVAKVEDVTVTGFTMPKGLVGQEARAIAAFSAADLRDMVRQMDDQLGRAPFGSGSGGGIAMTAAVHPVALPKDQDAFFVVAWEPDIAVDGYELFTMDGRGDWVLAETVLSSEVEYDATGHAVHIVHGNFGVGDERTFRVRAFRDQDRGVVSEPDTGVIIGPAGLVSPANGSIAPAQPRFQWKKHTSATAYSVYVAKGSRSNHVLNVIFDDPNVTEMRYPGDDPSVEPSLAAGEYLWYMAVSGPVMNGKTGGMAISPDWTFRVVGDNEN